jgi:hypothetical protein
MGRPVIIRRLTDRTADRAATAGTEIAGTAMGAS